MYCCCFCALLTRDLLAIVKFLVFKRSQLHWLDVVDRVRLRVCVQVCLHKMASEYLSTYCQPYSPASLAVATCDRLTVVISISHV